MISQKEPCLCIPNLSPHFEELGLRGANLSLGSDIVWLFNSSDSDDSEASSPKSTLRYIDLSLISSVTQLSLSYSPTSLLDASTLPLEVIELSPDVLAEVKRCQGNIRDKSKLA